MSTMTCAEQMVCAARGSLGAWEREAWALIAEAEQRGLLLTEEQLNWYDVRDLQAWRRRLASEHKLDSRKG
jgi:hypothetical protein